METSQDIRTLISEGVTFLNEGDRQSALVHFTIATQLQPDDEKLWLLRAESTDDPAEAVQCLEHVLEINPANKEARDKLVFFRVNSLQENAREATEVTPENNGAPMPHVAQRFTNFRFLFVAFSLLFCVLSVMAVGAFAILAPMFNPSNTRAAQVQPTPTQMQVTLPPTWTPTPTATPQPAFTVAPPPTWRISRDATVRSGPATTYQTLGVLKQDQRVSVLGKSKDDKYLQIEYPEPGMYGWVTSDYVEMPNTERGTLAIVTNVPTPTARPVQVAGVKPTDKPANTPTPAFEFDSTSARLVSDCNRQTGISGTIYANRGTMQPLSNVQLKITAFGQVQNIVVSGLKGQAGYWEWYFANNMDIVGDVTIVNLDGSPRSAPVPFRLSKCNGGSNYAIIDFMGTR